MDAMTFSQKLLELLVFYAVGPSFVAWVSWRTRRVPDPIFRQAFWDYWPSILRALISQILAIVAGMILTFYDNSGGHVFLFVSFASWLLVYLLMLERPHPGAVEKTFVFMLPWVIFSACVFLGWRRAA
jgi:hypothetical protein